MWNLKNKINEHRKKRDKPRNRLLTIESKLMVTRGEAGRRMDEMREGDKRAHLR